MSLVLLVLSAIGLSASFINTPTRTASAMGVQMALTGAMFVTYALGRTRHYRIGSMVLVGGFLAMPLAIAAIDGPSSSALAWQPLPLILAVVLLSARGAVVVAAINLLGLVLLSIFTEWTFGGVLMPIGLGTTIAGLLWLYGRTRDQVDRERRAELLQRGERAETASADLAVANQRLRQVVQDYVAFMNGVVAGNLAMGLTVQDNGREDDPLVALGHQLNQTVVSLRAMVTRFNRVSEELYSAAAEILAATTRQIAATSEQSSAISQTHAIADEVKVISEQAIQRAQEVVDASQRTVETSQLGRTAVEETVSSMEEIRTTVGSIAEHILGLVGDMEQIGEVVATVNDIAAQSSMLALNASVEAARAGEHGQGFGVVAAEVRGLAEQSQAAVAQIQGILTKIVDRADLMAAAGQTGVSVVDDGQNKAAWAGEAIRQLAVSIDDAGQTALQMKAGGQQQATGVEQIALAIESINEGTVQNISQARQMENAARELHKLAQDLTEVTRGYQV
jgi:methyl-accepting chemotaxis protein